MKPCMGPSYVRCALPRPPTHHLVVPTSHSIACVAPLLIKLTPPLTLCHVFELAHVLWGPLMRGAPPLAYLSPLLWPTLHITHYVAPSSNTHALSYCSRPPSHLPFLCDLALVVGLLHERCAPPSLILSLS
jgi:hypothetical protein